MTGFYYDVRNDIYYIRQQFPSCQICNPTQNSTRIFNPKNNKPISRCRYKNDV